MYGEYKCIFYYVLFHVPRIILLWLLVVPLHQHKSLRMQLHPCYAIASLLLKQMINKSMEGLNKEALFMRGFPQGRIKDDLRDMQSKHIILSKSPKKYKEILGMQ